MNIPEAIKVGHYTYDIKESDELIDASGRHGTVSHPNRLIRIDTTRGDVETADTLIHEMLHCIFYLHEIEGGDREAEEKLAARLTNGLCLLIADNPMTFRAIVDALDYDHIPHETISDLKVVGAGFEVSAPLGHGQPPEGD
ncbi:MAG: hypothetical protein OET63_04915 [Desulfobacterales bacterium]|nr:hypothetical protein [Desulfobacterales bacterium]